jgi:hypothetical protein
MKTDKVNMEILEQLKDLTTVELVELQINITKILQEREVSEDTIKAAVEYLYGTSRGSVRYTDLTLYLEKQGLRRESIARRVVDMWRKNPRIAHGGCPIGESESDENPIYPHVDNTRYPHICYLDHAVFMTL